MLWGGASYNNGILPYKNYLLGEAYTRDGDAAKITTPGAGPGGKLSDDQVARGVLAGKYTPGQAPPADSRAARGDRRIMQTEWREESLVLAQRIAEHARARGATPSQFAVAWVLNNAFVSSAIVGPRTLEQMREYLDGAGFVFGTEDEALIDGMVSPGHPSTPGYNDPAYPLEGRVSLAG